jgi:hypothetical protein
MAFDHGGGGTATVTATATPRSLSPYTAVGRTPFADDSTQIPRENPFASPTDSRPNSSPNSSLGSSSALRPIQQRYFHSRRIRKGEVEKPWMEKKDPKEKWVTIIPLMGLALGFAIAGFLVYDGLASVVHHNYCQIMSDDFSQGLNPDIWTKEAEVGGFGLVSSITHNHPY